MVTKNVRKCGVCGSDNIETLVEIPRYYYLIRPSEFQYEWRNTPLSVGVCLSCGVSAQLALPSTAVLDEIYSEYYGSYPSFASEGETDERHIEFRDYIRNSGVSFEGHALEIGSFDGKFLSKLKDEGMTVQGCDPNVAAAVFAQASFGIETVNTYFKHDTFTENSFDLVSARLVLEHVPKPSEFLSGLESIVRPGGHIAIEVPDCGPLIEAGIDFWMVEHFTFFTASSLLRALRRYGFDGKVSSQKGILRIVAKQIGRENLVTDDSSSDLQAALAFYAKHQTTTSAYNSLFDNARTNKMTIGVYGVGNFFTNLVSTTNLELQEIAGIFDGNPRKWDAALPGLGLRVKGPSELRADQIGLTVVATQSYEGVLKTISSYLENGGAALVGFPEPRLL